MKKILYLLLVLFLIVSCDIEKKPSEEEVYDYYVACARGDFESVNNYVAKYPEYIDAELSEKNSVFSYPTFAEFLIREKIVLFEDNETQARADFIRKYKRYPINIVSRYNKLEIVKLLISNKANVNLKEDTGYTPIYAAVQNNNLDMVNELIKGNPDLNEKENTGLTPLNLAIYNQNKDIVDILLQNGCDTEIFSQGYSPIMIASDINDVEIIRTLLKYGANVNAATDKGQTALHFATLKANKDAIIELLNNSANINCCDKDGLSPLMVSVAMSNEEILKIFLSSGADINIIDVNGLKAIDYAIVIYEEDHKNLNIVNLLINAGATTKNFNLALYKNQSKKKDPSSDFKYKLTDDGNAVVITKYIGSDKRIEIPKSIEGFPVRQIGQFESIFKGIKNIIFDELIIPDSVTTIKWDAFNGANIKKIIIPDSVKNLESTALSNIGYLEEIRLPRKINNELFGMELSSTCNLNEVIIPVSSSPSYRTEISVRKQSKVKKIVFPEGINYVSLIGNIKNVREIVLPGSLEYLMGRVLLNPDTKFSIPPTLKSLKFSHWDVIWGSSYFSPYICDGCSLREEKEIKDFWNNLGFNGYYAEENIF